MPPASPPPSPLWAEIFVAALAQAGLRRVVIAPGSRSTPLTLAFARRPEMRRYAAIDERGAAFFALGLALESGEPAALVCTSGTAAAEFFPAILEADAAEIPLLVLTADRPHELRHSGANQTTDQVKLYGGHVRWFVDAAPPEGAPSARSRRALRTLAARALAAARGFNAPPGPVHVNLPFRKPLEAALPAPAEDSPGTVFLRGTLQPGGEQVRLLANLIRRNRRGVILCGPRCPGGEFPQAVGALAQAAGYPVLAEALSGVRFGAHIRTFSGYVLGGYEHYLAEMPAPQVVLRFGALPVGKAALDWLDSLPDDAQVVHVSGSGIWQDETHRLNALLHAEPQALCRAAQAEIGAALREERHGNWLQTWQAREQALWRARREDWLPALLEALPQPANLFVASSLAVRHLGEQAPPLARRLRVFANRGLSGIDGTIASAAGVAAASGLPTLLLIGDLAFLHDMNSLHLLRYTEAPFVIALLNNDGGGIFHRLPIAAYEPPFRELFLMPHGMTFGDAARQFGLDYTHCDTAADLQRAAERAFRQSRPAVLEWTTPT